MSEFEATEQAKAYQRRRQQQEMQRKSGEIACFAVVMFAVVYVISHIVNAYFTSTMEIIK